MEQAIFTSTQQALSVAFLVMSVEARQKNSFRIVLMRIIESVQLPSARLKAWYKELQGSPGSVNFEGLDPYEVRAQMAMVTKAVEHHLPGPERDVVWARYGQQVERGNGVQGLSQYLKPQLPIDDIVAIQALIYGQFHSQYREKGLSYQDINRDRGIHVRTLKRTSGLIVQLSGTLEKMAIDRLTPMFERDGLVVPGPNSAMAA